MKPNALDYFNVGIEDNIIAVVNHIARKFGKFGELSMIHQTKTIQIGTYN